MRPKKKPNEFWADWGDGIQTRDYSDDFHASSYKKVLRINMAITAKDDVRARAMADIIYRLLCEREVLIRKYAEAKGRERMLIQKEILGTYVQPYRNKEAKRV